VAIKEVVEALVYTSLLIGTLDIIFFNFAKNISLAPEVLQHGRREHLGGRSDP
jgi:hypothetical protein